MIKKLIALIILFHSGGCILTYAQTQGKCSTPEHDKYLRSVNPEYAKERDEMESKIAAYIASHPAKRETGATLTIPVVVHIVWDSLDQTQNLTDEQVVSQIDVLNEDYSTTNANIVEVPSVWANLVGSMHLYFSLARRDEIGNSTTGITRTKTSTTSFNNNDDVKFTSLGGCDAWDRNHYLNIWVCDLQGSSGTILGYAQLPGNNANPATDGIVVHYEAFGRVGSNLKPQYNLGRTATHEIGHWLNLLHIWGDDNGCDESTYPGSDYIADTPDQADATYSCPSFPHVSCPNSPNGDMFENYMDYTDDKCMMLFTTDQRTRMNNAIDMFRDTLHSAESYATPLDPPLATDLKIQGIIADTNSLSNVVCEKYINPSITIQNAGTNTITSFTIKYRVDDDSLLRFNWSGSLVKDADTHIDLPQILVSEDLHIFIAQIDSVNGGIDDYKLDNFKTLSFLYSPSKYTCPVYPETPEISILPNLADESISIETKFKEAQKASLSIYNVLGKKIYTQDYLNTHGQFLNVYVTGFASGVYFVEIKTFNKQVGGKFVVRH